MANMFSSVLGPNSSAVSFMDSIAELPGKRVDDFMEQTQR